MKNSIFNAVCKTRYLALLVVLIFTCGNVWGAVPSGWSKVTSLSGIAAGDKIMIVTNDGSMYLNGSVSSGHFSATALDATHPARANAAGVIELVSTGTTDRYKLKLVSTNKYITATQAKSGGASISASSDNYGWQFESSVSGEFDAKYQETGKQAYCRSYSNSSFRTYGSKNGATFQIYKYSSATTYNVYLMSGCTGGSYSSNKGTSGSGTGAYSSCTKYSGISAGTSVTITATPTSGYQFDGWTDGGYSIIFDDSYNEITPSSTTSTTATFTMPSSDVVIWQCNFSESCTNSVTINKGTQTNCTISASAASVSTCSGTRQVTVSVTPNSCYAAPVKASVTSTGTTATWVSGPTLNSGHYDYVYSFAENATGTTTFNCSLSTKTTYTVRYETGATTCTGSNAISGSHANDTKTCGSGLTLPGATFTTTGYTQTGWSKTSCGSQYAPVGGSYTDNAAQTFYPVWTPNNYTVTWMVNGEAYTTGTPSDNANYGTKVTTLPTAPTPPCGDVFVGWSTTNIGSTGLDKDDDAAAITALNLFTTQAGSPIITGNTVFYAVFADYAE